MKHRISFLLAIALLAASPAFAAAKKKAHPAPKEHAAKTAPAQTSDFEQHVEQEIAALKDDVNTRATLKKVQEVEQKADETAGRMKLVTVCAAVIGFLLGCALTFIFARRMGRSEDNLKIT